ncbi:hypothetical protein [Arenicella xantha]|nr:hypothetical protein [Arenicella xantha]
MKKYLLNHSLIGLAVGLMLLALSACSDAPVLDVESDPVLTERVTISFSDGPNKGEYVYLASDLPNAGVSLSYSQPNSVSFFAASDLVSNIDNHTIGSLRRFTKGELVVGDNLASSWLTKPTALKQNSVLDCGRLEIRDTENLRDYRVVYGTFINCGPTTISELTEWQVDEVSNTRFRQVVGQFSDRVRLQVAMDSARFQNIESAILVEFSLIQREPIAAAASN